MPKGVMKIYPHPERSAHGGIPVAGEFYPIEDAKRLIGAGLAVRRLPAKAAKSTRTKTPPAPRPATEG